MGQKPYLAIALLIGAVLGFMGAKWLYDPVSKDEPLLDAPDSPLIGFRTWENGNWKFKLSSESKESSAEIALLENKALPFRISVNGATSPRFFQMDVAAVPHQPYSAVTLVGDEKEGFIKEAEFWSEGKVYRMKRTKAGAPWKFSETRLKK